MNLFWQDALYLVCISSRPHAMFHFSSIAKLVIVLPTLWVVYLMKPASSDIFFAVIMIATRSTLQEFVKTSKNY